MQYKIYNIRDNPDWLEIASDFFASKWRIDRQIYFDSISDSIFTHNPYPRWYLLKKGEDVIGSFGLIENDFMVRKDLKPWLCALYVEEAFRGNSLGASLLEHGRVEAGKLGFSKLYLCTDHVGYYEKYGWTYLGDYESESDGNTRVYAIDTTV